VQALVSDGWLERAPADPAGGGYRVERGRAISDFPHDPLELHRPQRPIGERPGARRGGP
jgi:hypothetical protein